MISIMQSSVAVLLSLSILFHSSNAIPLESRQTDWTTQQWDAIVIGAGPAGIIVADRLSEAGKKTLLLEQGGPSYAITGGTQKPSWLSSTSLSRVDVPGLYSSIYSDQGNLTCGSRVHAFGGCTIGGSSAINAGLFFQPPASDWDKYFPAGWKYADVLASINRLNARQPSSSVTSRDGKYYLQDIYAAAKVWLVNAVGKYQEIDFKTNPNAVNTVPTFGHPVYDYNKGQRGGPVTTYLQTALARSSFLLKSGVHVKSITRTKASTASGSSATPACPGSNGSTYTDRNGFTYAIHCAADNSVTSYTGRSISSGGFAACFAICDADAANKCIGFSYVGGDSGVCYLKNTEGTYPANPNVVSAYRVSGSGSALSSATGVIATVNGVDAYIPLTPTGRVVVSGGALMSPQILMWSGIGDSATLTSLQSAGILDKDMTSDKWIINSAVGAGLFDNPNTFIELRSPSVSAYVYNYSDVNPTDASLYVNQRSGPYSFAGQTSVFWDSLMHADGSVAGFQGTIGTSGAFDYNDSHTVTLNVYGTSGLKSSGRVILDSSGIAGPDGNVYYSNPQDATDIATFIRKLFDALPQSAFTPLNMDKNWSVQQIATYITTWSSYARGQVNHWSSSCRLDGSCADVNTTVKGTKNIHVVDASILAPLSVNPQMGVMIAAERASELILKMS